MSFWYRKVHFKTISCSRRKLSIHVWTDECVHQFPLITYTNSHPFKAPFTLPLLLLCGHPKWLWIMMVCNVCCMEDNRHLNGSIYLDLEIILNRVVVGTCSYYVINISLWCWRSFQYMTCSFGAGGDCGPY